MNREEVYNACVEALKGTKCLLLEAATGYGKSKLSIDIVNTLITNHFKNTETSMLLLVAKTIHKQTWKDEFKKWGGSKVNNITIECYESLRKYKGKSFDFIVMDETHHIGSEARMELLKTLKFKYMLGLSATIPQKLQRFFSYRYHSAVVSCDVLKAIEDNVLPEPQILVWPLELNNTNLTETIEINPKARGRVKYGTYKDRWKFKNSGEHTIIKCTQQDRLNEYDSMVTWAKTRYVQMGGDNLKNKWLRECGNRLEFLANCKNSYILSILDKLKKERTITFCKTIEQTGVLGKNCIHSKNKKATDVYNAFNEKKLNHITAVNILNENANLVDCKYAIFANLSSSDIVIPQRIGRALRHKAPVIIVPFYKGTREQEIVAKMFENYNRDFIKVIYSTDEIC